jgi:hypothetical protein
MNITKIALAALLVAGTASASLATEFDANLANRYPGFAGTQAQAPRALQAAPVQLRQPIQNNSAPLQAGGVG